MLLTSARRPRRRLFLVAGAFLAPALFLLPLPALQALAPARRENARRFERIWTLARDNFFDPRLKGVDWRAVGDRYRPQAESAGSDTEFAAVVNRMLGELHAPHLGYYDDDDLEFYLLKS